MYVHMFDFCGMFSGVRSRHGTHKQDWFEKSGWLECGVCLLGWLVAACFFGGLLTSSSSSSYLPQHFHQFSIPRGGRHGMVGGWMDGCYPVGRWLL